MIFALPPLKPARLLAALFFCAGAQAAPPAAWRDQVALYVQREAASPESRVEVEVGTLDARIDLSGCARLDPFLPPGTRLWGRTRVGLRCVGGASPVAYVPVQLRVYGPALVASRSLAAGTRLAAGDVRREEVELTREPPGALKDIATLGEQVLLRALAAGQPLRREYLRALPAISAGDPVRLVYAGQGFSISADGYALGTAANGETVRVRTPSGRTMSGTARPGRVVELAF